MTVTETQSEKYQVQGIFLATGLVNTDVQDIRIT